MTIVQVKAFERKWLNIVKVPKTNRNKVSFGELQWPLLNPGAGKFPELPMLICFRGNFNFLFIQTSSGREIKVLA